MPSRFRVSLLLALLGASAFAVQPQFLKLSSMRDFLEGDIDGLSVDSSGRLSLAPAVLPGPDLGALAVWAVAVDAQGVLYAGTGNDGKIFKIDGRTSQTFFDAPEPEVQAVAIGPDGRVYAATNPEGRVYAIDKAGKSTVFFDPEERYIWALAFDGAGRLWVATGAEGKIYRVDSKGQATSILTSQDSHITALAIAPSGGVFAGSSPSGLVYEIDAKDNVRVLYDSNYRESVAEIRGYLE
ncbi:MAG: two-component regulator propeller domain-containing protein, partial [Vicinamibacteria bacterium]